MPKLKPIRVTSITQLRRELAKAPWHQRFHAYKASMPSGCSIYRPRARPRLNCALGNELIVRRANKNEAWNCGSGVNVATIKWILGEWSRSDFIWSDSCIHSPKTLWLVEFRKCDVACIPLPRRFHGGKFRLFRAKVIKQVKVKHANI